MEIAVKVLFDWPVTSASLKPLMVLVPVEAVPVRARLIPFTVEVPLDEESVVLIVAAVPVVLAKV